MLNLCLNVNINKCTTSAVHFLYYHGTLPVLFNIHVLFLYYVHYMLKGHVVFFQESSLKFSCLKKPKILFVMSNDRKLKKYLKTKFSHFLTKFS